MLGEPYALATRALLSWMLPETECPGSTSALILTSMDAGGNRIQYYLGPHGCVGDDVPRTLSSWPSWMLRELYALVA